METIRATFSDGDLTRRAPVEGSLAPAAEEYNKLMFAMQAIIGRVIFNSKQVESVAKKLIKEAEVTVAGSEQQNSAAASAYLPCCAKNFQSASAAAASSIKVVEPTDIHKAVSGCRPSRRRIIRPAGGTSLCKPTRSSRVARYSAGGSGRAWRTSCT